MTLMSTGGSQVGDVMSNWGPGTVYSDYAPIPAKVSTISTVAKRV